MNGLSRKIKPYQLIAGCLAVFWMLLIFFFSSQPGDDSTVVSSAFSRGIVSLADTVLDMNLSQGEMLQAAEKIENLVRKLAHMTEFGFLSGCLYFTFDFDALLPKKKVIIASCVSIIYAASDELHQLFVPGRCAKVTDVFIDSAGAILVIAIILGVKQCISFLSNRRK